MKDKTSNNIGYWCAGAVARYPDRIAMIDLSRDAPREIRYRELESRLNRFASLVSGLGLLPGDRMAMAVGNRFEFTEIMFGAMRAGIVPVPLNTKLGAEVLDYTIRDAGCKAAVVEPSCNRFVVDVVNKIGLAHRLALDPAPEGWMEYEPSLGAAPDSFDPPELADDHPSFQPYTSGSTGRPKGVVLTHAGQLWWIRAVQKYWPGAPDDRSLVAVPLYHKNAMAGAIKPRLHCGGSTVILPDFEPRRFLRTLAEYRCTQAGGVPAVFTLLLRHRDLIESLDFSALNSLTLGSAPVQEELLREVEQVFGVSVGESYGLTEGGPVMIGPPLDGRKVPFGSCGVAWPEGEIKLLGPDDKEDPRFGELWVRNPGVTPGYYNLPEVNARSLVDGWLATGDLFEIDDDGFFFFRGRTDDMFNSGGENIYPKEVENLLLAHPDVSDASVVPLPQSVKGFVPVAMILLAPDAAATQDDLKQFCLDNGPAYAHPRRIEIVPEMPLNGAGKIDRLVVTRIMEERYGEELAGKS